MRRPRITRARSIALPRPAMELASDWLIAGVAVALLLTALLVP
jgi:hypothetical protein